MSVEAEDLAAGDEIKVYKFEDDEEDSESDKIYEEKNDFRINFNRILSYLVSSILF